MKTYHSLYTGLLACTIFAGSVLAQNPAITPLPPNAASLGKLADTPPTLFTGQINFNIPVHTIQVGSFSFPISINYNNNGLKVEESPSSVGHGWTLSATGVVNRQTRGLPDESSYGYYGFNNSAQKAFNYWNGAGSETEYINRQVLGKSDGEPDIFLYNVAGLSGKFFLSPEPNEMGQVSPKVQHIPFESSVKVELPVMDITTTIPPMEKGLISQFSIRDEKGNLYLFKEANTFKGCPNLLNVIESDDKYIPTHATSWYLSQIKTAQGENIYFHYTCQLVGNPPTISEQKEFPIESSQESFNNLDPQTAPQPLSSVTLEKVLDKITFPGGEVRFTYTTERNDWKKAVEGSTVQEFKMYALDKIEVFDGTSVIRTTSLNYVNGNRLLLKKAQTSGIGISENPYLFDYYNEDDIPGLPNVTTNYPLLFQQDHWGYWNGRSNTTLLPTYYGSTLNVQTGISTSYVFQGADKTTDYQKSISGVLKSVTVPTGGRVYYEYEGNEYITKPDDALNVTTCNNASYTYFASVEAKNTDSLKDTTFIVTERSCYEFFVSFSYKGGCPDITAKASVVNALTGQTVEEFSPSLVNQMAQKRVLTWRIQLPLGTYRMIAEITSEGQTCSPTFIRIEGRKQVLVNTGGASSEITLNSGGVRIKKITTCPGINSTENCIIRPFEYKKPDSQSSGKIVTNPIYTIPIEKIIVKLRGFSMPGTIFDDVVYVENIIKLNFVLHRAKSILPIATTLGSYIGYSHVIEYQGNAGENGKIEHTFLSTSTYPDENFKFPFPPSINNDWKRGKEIKNIVYKRNGLAYDEIQQTQNFYSMNDTTPQFKYSKLVGIKSDRKSYVKFIGSTLQPLPNNNITKIYFNFDDPLLFSIQSYKNESGWLLMDKTRSVETFSTGAVVSESLYRYSPIHQKLVETTTQGSDLSVIKKTFKYTEDFKNEKNLGVVIGIADMPTNTEDVLLEEEKEGITTMPLPMNELVEERGYRNNKLVSSKVQLYKKVLGLPLPVPSRTLVSIGNAMLLPKIYFDQYDGKNRVISYYLKDRSNMSKYMETRYLYAYEPYHFPIAEITNATEVQINSALVAANITNLDDFSIPAPTPATLAKIRTFQTYLPRQTLVKWFFHRPLWGVSAIVAPTGLVEQMEYDGLGRLKTIKNANGEIVKSYQYNYRPQ